MELDSTEDTVAIHENTEAAFDRALGGLPEDPVARAEERVRRLRATFATSLGLIAGMYRDRDWERLFRDDGTPYGSLAEVLTDSLSLSASMARRYVQGARDFYLPLLEMTVEGTRIEITSGDVAALGREGLEDAVSTARAGLEGVTDADEAGEVIDGAVDAARERKAARDAAEAEFGDGEGMGGGFDGFDPAASSPRGHADAMDDLPPDDDAPPDDLGDATYTGTEDDDPASDDLAEEIMRGAPAVDEDTLPEAAREVYRALQTLASMEVQDVAALIDYDTRGVLSPIDDAVGNVKRLRGWVETAPWFLARLS